MTPAAMRRTLVDSSGTLSMRRQCELLGIARASLSYLPRPASPESLRIMRRIDEIYTKWPFYGARRMAAQLRAEGLGVNRKRARRLMQLMGLEAIYQGPRTSTPHPEHRVYPYLLRNMNIVRPDHVWSTDITYLGLKGGFVYLSAVIDWYTRYVLAWDLSNTMDVEFCLRTLDMALSTGKAPQIFNTDQGSQYTSPRFVGRLESHGIAVSMDGRGRALDNVFIERLWRSVKYEEVFINDYDTVTEARDGLGRYFKFYNNERLHQALEYKTPVAAYMNMVS
jgi:putative transposase